MFQLTSSRAPGLYLAVMPGRSLFGDSEGGWEAGFDDASFAALWELGMRARQQYQQGEDLSGGDPVTYSMSIGCGNFYQWHVSLDGFVDDDATDCGSRRLWGNTN